MLDHLPSLPPKHSLQMYRPFWRVPHLRKRLDVGCSADRNVLIRLLAEPLDSIWTREELECALDTVATLLSGEWHTVYAEGIVTITIGPTEHRALSVYSDLVPLGLSLHALRDDPQLIRLLRKLSVHSHERDAATLEAFTAASYALAGFPVELEPDCGDCVPDFRVLFAGEWIYGECKREHVTSSKYMATADRFCKAALDQIASTGPSAPPDYRFDIIVPARRPSTDRIPRIISGLTALLRDKTYGSWVPLADIGVAIAINRRESTVSRPTGFTRFYNGIATDKASPVSETQSSAQVLVRCFGVSETKKIRRLVADACSQLPEEHRGMIFLELEHPGELISTVKDRLTLPRHSNVVGALVTGNGAWWVKNGTGPSMVPFDFATVPVKGSPRKLPQLSPA